MNKLIVITWTWFAALVSAVPLGAQEDVLPPATAQINLCLTCHAQSDLWEGERRRFFITQNHLANDIHWRKGILCHDCHGGDPTTLNFRDAHSPDAGYRIIESRREEPQFCGHCHSDVEFMSRFQPSPKTNQEVDYWTSGHGKRIMESPDSNAATCVSCHSYHDIRAVNDVASPAYPKNVAKTCATCHSDAEKMAGIQYHGRPIGHDQYDLWMSSVHAKLLMEDGDLSAPTCNDCHGNHGAVAPDPNSVASACATCHVKIGSLFDTTVMKHRFEEIELPGCATCHGNHAIQHPTDEMLGMGFGAVCANCHAGGNFGATLAGAEEADALSNALRQLKQLIADAEHKVERAERLGMEVAHAKFRLRDAHTALSVARVEIHGFAVEPMQETLEKGMSVTAEVDAQAEKALQEYTRRRIWLGLSLVPIGIVVVLLLLYIRSMPQPAVEHVDLGH